MIIFAVLIALTGCTHAADEHPREINGVVRTPVDPSFLHGTDGGELDRLAATTITEVQNYWRQEFPPTFSRPWQPLDGGYFSVDSTGSDQRTPPCVGSAREIEGNAYYCRSVDAMAWDRAALLPVLRDRYGDAAIVMVLAHEMGHAVQQRSGFQSSSPALSEAMADCYAGSFFRWASHGHAQHLRLAPADVDAAARALITFRDTSTSADSARGKHGNAFDRVSALLDGFRGNAGQCSRMSTENTRFTQEELSSSDEQARGNEPLAATLKRKAAMDKYFSDLVASHGGHWDPQWATFDEGQLAAIHGELGDHAATTLLASRYGLAALPSLGHRAHGLNARSSALCLAGSYQRAHTSRSTDLDESVQLILTEDSASRDAAGDAIPRALQRFAAFRTGMREGPEACLRP